MSAPVNCVFGLLHFNKKALYESSFCCTCYDNSPSQKGRVATENYSCFDHKTPLVAR